MPKDPGDIEPRLLRGFLAVADDMHFTRAAARMYVAQQALSRDIARLERELGVELFVRTTRQVSLSADGERLLPYARRVLAAHDELAAAFAGAVRPLLVDVSAPVGTAQRVLAEARGAGPELEWLARFHSGLTGAAAEILAGRLDVSFGRAAGIDLAGLDHCPVRFEPMAVVLREGHRLAGYPRIPVDALAGETVYAGAGNAATAEWTDHARELFAGRGISVAPPLPEISGAEEFIRVMGKLGRPILATVEFIEMPGWVLRPLVDPVPLSPVSMVWRRGLHHPGLDTLRAAAARLAAAHEWLTLPPDGWLPARDRALAASAATG